jgi:hypothetical protein
MKAIFYNHFIRANSFYHFGLYFGLPKKFSIFIKDLRYPVFRSGAILY